MSNIRKITITVEVDMDTDDAKEWRYPDQYFENAVKAAFEDAVDKAELKEGDYEVSEMSGHEGTKYSINTINTGSAY